MLITSGAPSIRYCIKYKIDLKSDIQEETYPAVLHGLLVELDLDRVQGAGVGEAVVLDRVIGVVTLVNRHCQLCGGGSGENSEV